MMSSNWIVSKLCGLTNSFTVWFNIHSQFVGEKNVRDSKGDNDNCGTVWTKAMATKVKCLKECYKPQTALFLNFILN